MSKYDHLDKDALIRLLKRRDADRQLGLVWERDEIEADAALNEDYVALDFVVCLHGRAGDGIALVEFKGDFLAGKDSEVQKADARHLDYGRVYMVGRNRGTSDFIFLRELGGKLQSAGAFNVELLQFP